MNDHQLLAAYNSASIFPDQVGGHIAGLRTVRDAALTEPGVFSESDSINDIVNQIIAMYPEQTGDLLAEYRAAKARHDGFGLDTDGIKREALRFMWAAAYLAGKADAEKIQPSAPVAAAVEPTPWEYRGEEARTQALVSMTFADLIHLRAKLDHRYEETHARAGAITAALDHIGKTVETMLPSDLANVLSVARLRADLATTPAGPPAA